MYAHVFLYWVVKAEDKFFQRPWSELRAQIIIVGIDIELVASGHSGSCPRYGSASGYRI